jgi:hypothetical protein
MNTMNYLGSAHCIALSISEFNNGLDAGAEPIPKRRE